MNSPYKILSHSVKTGDLEGSEGPLTCMMARDERSGERVLVVRSPNQDLQFTQRLYSLFGDQFFALTPENAAILRQMFPWLTPVPMEMDDGGMVIPSFGFGDRLGQATPGHIQALRAVTSDGDIYPILAQQSVRENARTGRTPQEVMDDAMWGVFQEGWQMPWGADADHLKQVSDLPVFVASGYTFFTVDPGEHVDAEADTAGVPVLMEKITGQTWGELGTAPLGQKELVYSFQAFCDQAGWRCDTADVELGALRAFAKYGRAVIHITKMYRALKELKPGGFDFEVSVDETETPTSLLEHFYIVSELRRLGVRFNSLALRFPGRFEKGVDYIGDLSTLEPELGRHAAIMRQFGGYRLSLHSGSDKFSIYPLLVKHAGRSVHVKTAGTSYLEALRVAAALETGLFRQVLTLAREHYTTDRVSYHVSAVESRLPDPSKLTDEALPALLDDFHVRQALHVTFGSALNRYRNEINQMLKSHAEAYDQDLVKHFKRHLEPLV
ncbi:MAG TPA: tagaturonate epimerase family protein [Bellilinea sp.]|nr:tagaturonate epimerase family protein [Bellilinea sp.]